MTGWSALIIAGFLEIGFTSFLKLSGGFSGGKPLYLTGFFVCASASFYFLSRAIETIPLGTAYAVWTGVGACGTAIIGMLFFDDPAHIKRIFFLALLVGSIIGLKFFSSH
jgi:quaternary ammonium compound-resistance protein SugE